MFRVLHSSAGAGKTHALVKHYLALALNGDAPDAYRSILALTFTNKAANEMRERTIDYLQALRSEQPPTRAVLDVRETLLRGTGMEEARLRERAANTLKHMLHHWPMVAISTIDAFTRRVVMPFARDLRLDSDLRMTTDEQYYRDKAVDLLLQEAGTDKALTDLLVATCEQLLEEERDWRADKPLRALTGELTKEQALDHLQRLRHLGNEQFIAIQRELRKDVSTFRDRLRTLGRSALDTLEAAGIGESELAYGKGGPLGYLKQLAAFDAWMEEKKNTLKVLSSDKWHSTSADPATQARIRSLAPLLRNAIEEAEAHRTSGSMRLHALRVAILRDLLPAATLNSIDERLERIKKEEGIAFFSDLLRKVATIVQSEPAPFLYERVGERYQHFLIDEFQDTSLMQWQALIPLVENALSSGGSALLVGDAKQAIYRWRNGEARQFVLLPEIFAKEKLAFGEEREATLIRSHTPIAPLNENYRSARSIIMFNNSLFTALADVLPEDLRAVYTGLEQGMVSGEEGLVHIHAYGARDTESGDRPTEDPRAELAWACVREALDDGFLPGDIAVLVRAKKLGRTIADRLVREGMNVVSPDGLSLGGDAGNRAAMAVFSWLQRPDDASAAQAVQRIAQLGNEDPQPDPAAKEGPAATMRSWVAAHPRTRDRNTLISTLVSITDALKLDPATDAFTSGLLNEAHAFISAHGDDAPGFMEHWERVSEKRSIGGSESDDAVRILTIHASKGLQYPVVIVPDMDMGSRGNKGEMLWMDTAGTIPDLPSALVRRTKMLGALEVPEAEIEEQLSTLDELDLLYVAFTRPEQRLYAGVPGGGERRIMVALRDHLHLSADESWTAGSRATSARRKGASRTSTVLAPTLPHARVPLALRHDAPQEWDPVNPDPYRSHGRMIHAVLARVRVASDLEEAVRVEGDIAGLDEDERASVRAELTQLLERSDLHPFFGKGLSIRTETTMIDEQGHAHRPDRIASGNGSTRVLDIKTGARSEEHLAQVKRYADLLARLGEPNVSGHLLYVRSGELIDVP